MSDQQDDPPYGDFESLVLPFSSDKLDDISSYSSKTRLVNLVAMILLLLVLLVMKSLIAINVLLRCSSTSVN